ncbi:MAG: SpoIID/LytB domain-containing protein [Clostridia bacterium]|nr:SpoIID/LytB domain-containing protein [Clostridia bacterium]
MSAKKRSSKDLKKLIVRILCLFLALLMVGGVLYSFIYSLAFSTNAAEEDTYVKVGLYWDSTSQASYTLSSGVGFLVGDLDSQNVFTVTAEIPDAEIKISSRESDLSENAVIAVLSSSDEKLLEISDSQSLYIKSAADDEYMTVKGSNSYGGVFQFTRNGDYSMKLINILPLEEYVLGVLPNEISSYYPAETKKAFAVTVRSYTLSSLSRHSSSGFNLCNTTCCQVYRGRKGVNDGFIQAVNGSRGMVMSYNQKVVQAYYSAITGGTTSGVYETWGSNFDYLKAIATPWEKYEGASNGVWTVEYTPDKLFERLTSRGYELSGSIADVEIEQLAENSTYVYKLKITDTTGKSVVITRTDKIRTVLGLKSANFVCGRAGETVERINYVIQDTVAGDSQITVMTADGLKTATDLENITVASKDGINTVDPQGVINVRTAYGKFAVDVSGRQEWSSELDKMLNAPTVPVKESVTLSGTDGSFVFYGRGWGHGVGMSQTGARDLGNLGADYMTILTTYFPGISVVDYKNLG